jgi:DNA-3-methyladenine glycosylase
MNVLPRSFYGRGAEDLARDLVGRVLVRSLPDGRVLRGRLVEVEAYVGMNDKACHAHRGKTARNATMFGPPGHAYVYLVYGMYNMLNLVCAEEGDPQAVLVRALEPVEPRLPGTPWRGPGVLCRELAVERSHDGLDLCAGRGIWLEPGTPAGLSEIVATPRIGVDYAEEWKDAPLRFCLRGSAHVSGKRPS